MMARAKVSGTATENKQFKRFVESARALECDESEERFDAALRKIAAHKPSGDSQNRAPVVKEKRPSS
jgi:hypothetical protein